MKNLVMGFGGRRKRKTSAAKARQLEMLEKMKDYCEEEGVCRRYSTAVRTYQHFLTPTLSISKPRCYLPRGLIRPPSRLARVMSSGE